MKNLLLFILAVSLSLSAFSKEGDQGQEKDHHGEKEHTEIQHAEGHDSTHGESHDEGHADAKEGYDPAPMIMHHIADANEWHLFKDVVIPLPVIMYNASQKKWMFGMSNQFGAHHGEGTKEVDGYVMSHSRIKSKKNLDLAPQVAKAKAAFASWKAENEDASKEEIAAQKEKVKAVTSQLDKVIDFSITKNVATLLLTAGLMLWFFTSVARGYKKNQGKAPKGIQSFFEPLILFVRDEIAKPNLGKKTDKFLPYLLAVFFFIWIGNMLGQVAPIGSPNLTGNIAVTAVLSLFTLLMINLNGNKHYWMHMLDPMGNDMPWYGKLFLYPILVPIELAGIVIKPVALMIRLFANITAGHIIVLSLVSLIFVFGNAGQSIPGSIAGTAVAVPFALFISVIELLVAFLQAFIFTILTAVFIGMAVDDGHH